MAEINSISPILQSYIQQASTQTTQSPIKKSPKDFIKSHKKEILISSAAALALGAVVLGGIIYGKKTGAGILRKSEQILTEGDNILQKSQSLTESAKSKYEEVLSLIEQGKTTNFEDVADESGNIIRKFEYKEDTSEIAKMLEYKNGILSRQTEISSTLKPQSIEEFIEGTNKSDKYLFNESGNIGQIQLGYSKAKGSQFIKEVFDFEDDELTVYSKGYFEDSDGNVKIKNGFAFEDGKLEEYNKGYFEDSDGNVKIAKKLTFEDGKIVNREKNIGYGDTEDDFDDSDYFDDSDDFDDSDFIDDND